MREKYENKVYAGSLTVEAAIAVPLFLFLMMTLLSMIDMLHFYGRVEQGLHQAGRRMAVYAPAAELITGEGEAVSSNAVRDLAISMLGEEYAKNYLAERFTRQDLAASGLIGGVSGLDFTASEIMTEEDIIDLIVSYQVEPRGNFFMLPAYTVINRCRMRAWTGYEVIPGSADQTEERMVYITETGTVFHLTETCTYLDLSICPVTADELVVCRTDHGGIYQSCEICGGEAEVYYITNYGDCYHTTLSCSGIRRTIYQVPLSQVGDRRACSRCGSNGF